MDDLPFSLLCEEDLSCFDEDSGDEEQQQQHPFIQKEEDFGQAEDEYVGVLIEKEIGQSVNCFKKDETLVDEDWLKGARMIAIDWILKTTATFGLRFETAYLSVTYFDRIFSRQSLEKIQLKYVSSNKCWAIQLLSIACLSLAAKMEECDVPALLAYSSTGFVCVCIKVQVGQKDNHLNDPRDMDGSKTHSNCIEMCAGRHANYTPKMIQKMELLVLTTLEWNMGFVTPFSFLLYFITKLCRESPPSPVFSKAMKLILATMKEVNSMDHKPSVIAAAATLVALDQKLTLETVKLKMSLIPQHQLIEPNDVFGCYILIQRLYEVEKIRGDRVLCTPNSSSPFEMIESSDQAWNKRRRQIL